jgi:transglutaminase-like putative cysteine protease
MSNSKPRVLQVRHTTHYTYDRPVQRSSHRLRLRPIADHKQRLLDYTLRVEPEVAQIEYEDVFGNFVTRFDISTPYTKLTVDAESVVEVQDVDPFAFTRTPNRPLFPVVWMPWERTMLEPYLVPVELPDTQLQEIHDYAMKFIENNNRDLMEALFAINLTLFREFKYVPGSTSLQTTPFEVMTNRRGVCQDFATLFICMARMLGIPARYVCGYILTHPPASSGTSASPSDSAPAPATQPPSEQSHAWIQLYIPNVGWKGFDPTNGILTATEHVRVSIGRNYRDTAPTAGTLYTPARESLNTAVQITDITGSIEVAHAT